MSKPRIHETASAGMLARVVCAVMLIATAACSHKAVRVPVAGAIVAPDRSYVDLQPGWRLRIVIPLLKPGTTAVQLLPQQGQGTTITLSAANLIGYETSDYSVKGKASGAVRLKFSSAATTKDGKTIAEPGELALPFTLPKSTGHIRLIYLIRASQADHNMAIVASRHIQALAAFTKRLQATPGVCESSREIFCSWVPAGVAVRPEKE